MRALISHPERVGEREGEWRQTERSVGEGPHCGTGFCKVLRAVLSRRQPHTRGSGVCMVGHGPCGKNAGVLGGTDGRSVPLHLQAPHNIEKRGAGVSDLDFSRFQTIYSCDLRSFRLFVAQAKLRTPKPTTTTTTTGTWFGSVTFGARLFVGGRALSPPLLVCELFVICLFVWNPQIVGSWSQ